MGTITFGGLATGLDTNSIVTQLVALERQRSLDPLTTQQTTTTNQQSAFQTFNTKLLTLLTAVNKLSDPTSAIVQQASSSDASVVTATAGSGALTGTTEITVNHLAQAAIASSASGKASATSTIATGSGSFAFRVGTGTVQTIAIDTTTTLDQLASAINDTKSGATASVVNVGTDSNPDFRLRIASDQTGTANAVSIVTDDTTLGVAVSQPGADASFNVSGFTDPLSRSTNTVSDVIPGVTLNLLAKGGPVTVTVGADVQAVTDQVNDVVKAFNDIQTFVDGQSTITQDTTADARTVTIGPLALDGTVRGILDSLHSIISSQVSGVSDQYGVLAQIGITTQRDGTLAFDTTAFQTELGAHGGDVAALFAGSGSAPGVADKLADYLNGITAPAGLIDVHSQSFTTELSDLSNSIAAGQRNLDAFQANLQEQYTNLELVVSTLKSQNGFLSSALGTSSSSGSGTSSNSGSGS